MDALILFIQRLIFDLLHLPVLQLIVSGWSSKVWLSLFFHSPRELFHVFLSSTPSVKYETNKYTYVYSFQEVLDGRIRIMTISLKKRMLLIIQLANLI